MSVREMICVSCPTGCRLTVKQEGDKVLVEGNACKRGVSYGISEFTNPVRMVSTLVRVKGGERSVVSVRTTSPVPKNEVAVVLELCRQAFVTAPVTQGDVLMKNVSSGVDIIATASNALKHK